MESACQKIAFIFMQNTRTGQNREAGARNFFGRCFHPQPENGELYLFLAGQSKKFRNTLDFYVIP